MTLPVPGLSVIVLVLDPVNNDALSLLMNISAVTTTPSGVMWSRNAIFAKMRSMNLPVGWKKYLSMVRPAPMLSSIVAVEENDDPED